MRKYTSEEIKFHLETQKQTKQTIKSYCEINDLKYHTFKDWRKASNKAKRELQINKTSDSFIEIPQLNSITHLSLIKIKLPNKIELEIQSNSLSHVITQLMAI